MMITNNQIRIEKALRNFLANGTWKRGDRLPSYAEIAECLHTSVSVLQAIMPRLVSDGTVEVIPRVGTFLLRLPRQLEDGQSAQTLRFAITESPNGTSPGWRAVATRFEQLHPGLGISFTLSLSNDQLLTKPDLILLQHEQARLFQEKNKCIPWADDFTWKADERVDFVRAIWKAERPAWGVPVLLGMPITYVSPAAPISTSDDISSLIADCQRSSSSEYGFVASSVMEPLWSLGLGDKGVDPGDRRVIAWLHSLASVPPPALVTATDFLNKDLLTILDPLINGRCSYFMGSLWMSRVINDKLWRLRLPTACGPLRYGVMSLVVPEGPRANEAITFAKFISGPEGQGILGEKDSLLPTLRDSVLHHKFYRLLSEMEERPLAPANVLPEQGWMKRFEMSVQMVNDLRAGRASIGETLAALAAVGPAWGVT